MVLPNVVNSGRFQVVNSTGQQVNVDSLNISTSSIHGFFQQTGAGELANTDGSVTLSLPKTFNDAWNAPTAGLNPGEQFSLVEKSNGTRLATFVSGRKSIDFQNSTVTVDIDNIIKAKRPLNVPVWATGWTGASTAQYPTSAWVFNAALECCGLFATPSMMLGGVTPLIRVPGIGGYAPLWKMGRVAQNFPTQWTSTTFTDGGKSSVNVAQGQNMEFGVPGGVSWGQGDSLVTAWTGNPTVTVLIGGALSVRVSFANGQATLTWWGSGTSRSASWTIAGTPQRWAIRLKPDGTVQLFADTSSTTPVITGGTNPTPKLPTVGLGQAITVRVGDSGYIGLEMVAESSLSPYDAVLEYLEGKLNVSFSDSTGLGSVQTGMSLYNTSLAVKTYMNADPLPVVREGMAAFGMGAFVDENGVLTFFDIDGMANMSREGGSIQSSDIESVSYLVEGEVVDAVTVTGTGFSLRDTAASSSFSSSVDSTTVTLWKPDTKTTLNIGETWVATVKPSDNEWWGGVIVNSARDAVSVDTSFSAFVAGTTTPITMNLTIVAKDDGSYMLTVENDGNTAVDLVNVPVLKGQVLRRYLPPSPERKSLNEEYTNEQTIDTGWWLGVNGRVAIADKALRNGSKVATLTITKVIDTSHRLLSSATVHAYGYTFYGRVVSITNDVSGDAEMQTMKIRLTTDPLLN